MMEEYFNDVDTFFEKIINWDGKKISAQKAKLPLIRHKYYWKYRQNPIKSLHSYIFTLDYRDEKLIELLWIYLNVWRDNPEQTRYSVNFISQHVKRYNLYMIQPYFKLFYTWHMERKCFQNNKRLYS